MRGKRVFAVGLVSSGLILATLVPAGAQDLVWIRQFGTASDDVAFDIATDGPDTIYVGGRTFGLLPGQIAPGNGDAFVRRYDAGGAEVWTRQFGTDLLDEALGIATDGFGNVYVVGHTFGALPGQGSSGGQDAFVRRYDAGGAEVWTRQFGTGGVDVAYGVAADGADNIYVTGLTSGTLLGQVSSGGQDAFLRLYDAGGNAVWTHQFGTAYDDAANGVAADGAKVYVDGWTGGALPGQVSSGGQDAFVRRYDAGGTEVWTHQFGSASPDFANGVAASGANVYVAGETRGALPGQVFSGGVTDVFVRRYDAGGAEVWTRQFGTGAGPIYYHVAYGVAIDGFSNVYISGRVHGALPGQVYSGNGDAFVRRYDAGGAVAWTRQFGTWDVDQAFGVATDGARNLYVAGQTFDALPGQVSSGSFDAFVVRLQQRTCWDTANPQGNEIGPVSGFVHGTLEPLAGAGGPAMHQGNCTQVVPRGA